MEYGIKFINNNFCFNQKKVELKSFYVKFENHIGLLTRSHSSYLYFISKLDNSDNLFLCFELDFINNLFV